MVYLISSIIALCFSVAFYLWGLYQVRTGKMVARHAKNPVDEPKEVGALFLMIGVVGFWLAYIFGLKYFFPDPCSTSKAIANITGYVVVTALEGFVIWAIYYGSKDKRIFGIKNTLKIHRFLKQYYLIVNFSLLICSILSTILFFCGSILPQPVAIAMTCTIIVFGLIAVYLMLKIEKKNKTKK